jgi:hypothetical protein
MEWATMEGERESFFSILVDLNVGEPKRDVGMQTKRYLYLLGAQRLLWAALPAWKGSTAALPITAGISNCFSGCYGRV